MTTADAPAGRTPWHLWLVGAISLIWNGFGGYDYTMAHVVGEPYHRQMGMTDAQIAALDAYPVWMHAVWATGVWFSVLGAVLLLLRSKWATHAFVVSILGALGNLAYALAGGSGATNAPMTATILAACAFFIWYCWTMTKRGVLR